MKNDKKLKRIFIISSIILMSVLFFLCVVKWSINAQNEMKSMAELSGTYNSIKDILEHYECKFIKEKNSTENKFFLDIYTSFKVDLYTENSKNESFYNNVINDIAKFIGYKNFRIIDENKDNSKIEKIEIQVFCNGEKVKRISINGIEDYFIYMDSQIDMSKYKELKQIELEIQSPELIECIQNNWSKDINFGTRETIFQNYYIYFDEGIKTRKIDGKIYNIIFDKKYENPIVNDFTVGTENDIIISKLGNPTFQNTDKSIIGYKSENIYVFFEKDQISVYRNIDEEGFDDFYELVDKFENDEYNFKEFMNELTYVWSDYDEYTYDSSTVFLSYPNKGIDIKLNYDDISGIVLYNNVGIDKDKLNEYIKSTDFIAQLQIDNVYNAELRRYEKETNFNSYCNEYKEKYESENSHNRGNLYNYYMKISNENILCVYFISETEEYPNCELYENVTSYIWINDYCFVYGIKGKGLYYYDLKNQAKGILMTGTNNFEIKSYENGILSYDDENMQLQY